MNVIDCCFCVEMDQLRRALTRNGLVFSSAALPILSFELKYRYTNYEKQMKAVTSVSSKNQGSIAHQLWTSVFLIGIL